MANVTSHVGPAAAKWSRGTDSVMHVNSLSGQPFWPTYFQPPGTGDADGTGATDADGVGDADGAADEGEATADGAGDAVAAGSRDGSGVG